MFIRQVEVRFIFVQKKMLRTIAMDGTWKKIELDRLGVDKTKMANQMTPQDNANQVSDSYGQLYAGICIATDPNNADYVYIAERPNADPKDCIALWVGWEMERPLTDVKALNELYVTGTAWDLVYVQAL